MMFEVRPLRNEADYDAALEAISVYFENEPAQGSQDADRFDLLALVIADYEARHWAIEAPDAPDLLRVQMRQKGLRQSDLATLLGSKTRASEILNRRRHLTLQQAWKLHTEWRLPTDALIKPYALRSAGTRTSATSAS
jgi:HTH-type transcriptional regulator/antitoxin HigA